MTKKEILNWISEANWVDTPEEIFDYGSLEESIQIYEKNGEYYQLEFYGGNPSCAFEDGQFKKDEYRVEKVKKVIKLEEVVYWEGI